MTLFNQRNRPRVWPTTLVVWLLCMGGVSNAMASLGEWLYESNRTIETWLAGMAPSTLTVNGERWHFYHKKDNGLMANEHTHCTVLLHGFAAEGAHWLRFVSQLAQDHCVVAPDLPGFGHSAFVTGTDYSILAQVHRLQAFLRQAAPANGYHLVGSSMGGQIAGLFAVTYPNRVASLTLINPGGVQSPGKSDMDVLLETTGRSVFDVSNVQEYRAMFDMTMSDPPWIPGVVMTYLGESAVARNTQNRYIFQQVFQKDLLDGRLATIRAPTLIIWGQRDQLLHAAMADVFHQGIPASSLVRMPALGHLPFLEHPASTAAVYNGFINGLEE